MPSTGAPSRAIAHIREIEKTDILGYTSSLGIKPLRERIAQMYADNYDVNLDPARVVVTIGASGALLLAALACFDEGDQFALPYPAYPAYTNTLHALGLQTVGVPTHMNEHMQPTVKELRAVKENIRGIIVASPSNPGGTMLSAEELEGLVKYCNEKGITYISDEIYHGIVFDHEQSQQTALKYSDDVIIMNSFSKYYSMPGWRVGWMVVPDYLVDRLAAIARNLYISPAAASQHVALKAMDCTDDLNKHIERYRRNRDILLQEMPKAGFDKFLKPQGAFYFYAHVANLHKGSSEFALKMLAETGVAAMPGTPFDPINGHQYMRFSYAGSTEDIEEAIKRLQAWKR